MPGLLAEAPAQASRWTAAIPGAGPRPCPGRSGMCSSGLTHISRGRSSRSAQPDPRLACLTRAWPSSAWPGGGPGRAVLRLPFLVRPGAAGLTGGNARQPHPGAGMSAIGSLQLLSRIESIVPDGFQGQEGLTSDDVQAGRLVIHNKVLRRRVACRNRQGPRWRESRNGNVGDAWSTARPSGDGA